MIDWGAVVTLAEKNQRKVERDHVAWKQDREALVAAIKVQVGDLVFQGDEVSQGRMARAVIASASDSDAVEWTLADNTVVPISVSQLREVLRLASEQQTAIWNEGRPV